MCVEASALADAVQRLREGRARCDREPADEQLRDGLIQRFEFTYELCHKTLRRYLRETAASPRAARKTFPLSAMSSRGSKPMGRARSGRPRSRSMRSTGSSRSAPTA